MSNLENLINNQEEQYEYNNEDDFDFDFENLEMPQLVRRNGAIQQENVQGYIILGNMIDKMFKEEACPICLSEDEELYPLFCGHTFAKMTSIICQRTPNLSRMSSVVLYADNTNLLSHLKVIGTKNCFNKYNLKDNNVTC